MLGLTVWGMRNLVAIIVLLKKDCLQEGDSVENYKFWLLNFMVISFVAFMAGLLTVVVIPVMSL